MNHLTVINSAPCYDKAIPQHYSFKANGNYWHPTTFNYFNIVTDRNRIPDLDHLKNDLLEVSRNPLAAIVRGTLRHNQEEAHNAELSTLSDEPQNWICIPIDGLKITSYHQELSPQDFARHIVDNHFPEEFHNARFILQLRSLAGYNFDWSKFHANLYFWNKTPITCRELQRYFNTNNPTYGLEPLGEPFIKFDEIGHDQRIITAQPEYVFTEDPVLAHGEKRVQMVEGSKPNVSLTIPEIPYDKEYFNSRPFRKALFEKSKGNLSEHELKKMCYAIRNLGYAIESARLTLNKCRSSEAKITTKQVKEIYADPEPHPEYGKDTLLKFAGII